MSEPKPMTTIIFQVDDDLQSTRQVCMTMGFMPMMPGDFYHLKTHETPFNKKIKKDIPDGLYLITRREWVHHMADVNEPSLQIYISTFPAKKAKR